ncbi:MAG: hypothetical protein ACRDRU_13600 [Pseudonocardiaceae bacterium]
MADRSGEAEAPSTTRKHPGPQVGAHLVPGQVQRLHQLLADFPPKAN